MSPSSDVRKRLLYAKYLLMRAESAQKEIGDIGAAVSLTLMHDGAEMLMIAVLDHLGIQPAKRNRDFLDFWKELKDADQPEPPFRTAMDRLNNLRVGFKHKGNLPSAQTVRDLMPSLQAFFEEVTSRYLNLDFGSFDLADLVDFADVQFQLKQARKHFGERQKQDAFIAVRMAYDALVKRVESDVPALAVQQVRITSELGPLEEWSMF
jgi:hypothetical protein